MSRPLLNSGAIICSTMVVYGWTQASALEPASQNCEDQSATALPSQTSDGRAGVSTCAMAEHPVTLSNVVESLPMVQWGDRRSHKLPVKMETIYGDMLKRAQASASRSQYMEAVAGVSGIPKNSRYYGVVQQVQEDWSRELLRQATDDYKKARMTTAISMLDAIPADSEWSSRVSELRKNWNRQSVLLNRAIAAKQVKDWQAAIDALQLLEGTPLYNSFQVQELLQFALTQLYEPNQALVQLALEGLPAEQLSTAPPETIPATPNFPGIPTN